MPPTPTEIAEFEASFNKDADAAVRGLVEHLLSSPHYGERMALPWLDAARYADSNGFQQDGDTFQWIWRDWVVKAINDKFSGKVAAGNIAAATEAFQIVHKEMEVAKNMAPAPASPAIPAKAAHRRTDHA